MPLTYQHSPDKATVTIQISDRFDFKLHREFRQAFSESSHPATKYVIDLGQTRYMDSSALGMLLTLREQAGNDRADIRIINCSPEIERIFSISNFGRMFKFG